MFWGLEDDGDVYEGNEGRVRSIPAAAKNAHDRAFGSDETAGMKVDTDTGVMSFYRQCGVTHELIEGATIRGLPLNDAPLYFVGCPFNSGAALTTALPTALY
jgi:hypothetical protein